MAAGEPIVPDYTARVAGARSWRVANTMWARMGGLLWADAMLEPWPVGKEYEAACTASRIPHEVPGELCSCGIWAWYNPENLVSHWRGYNSEDCRRVSGIVSGAGVMWLHALGWRAQRVHVEAIFKDDIPEEMLPTTKREISAAYDIPIIAAEEYEAFCEKQALVMIKPEDL